MRSPFMWSASSCSPGASRARGASSKVSVTRSPALGKVIGLAYAHADDAELGKTIQIKLDSGQVVDATVASPQFYDPDNTRQEM